MDIAQFGQTIKQKYPEYQDMEDADLGQRMLSKYPQYQDMIDTPTQPTQPKQAISTGLVTGALKGAGSTLESGFRSGGQIVGGIGGAISVPIQEKQQGDLTSQYEQLINMAKNASPIEKSSLLTKAREIQGQIQKAGQPSKQFAGAFDNPLLAKAREFLTPKTTAEKVGYGAEKIGEYFIPGGMTNKATQGAGLLGRAGAQGVASAGVKLAQTGAGTGERKSASDTIKEAMKTGAIAGSFSAGTELASKGISSLLDKAGSKIQFSTIKPSRSDVADGFSTDTIKKYSLGGNQSQMLDKTETALKQSREYLKKVLTKSDGEVNLNEVLTNMSDDLVKGKLKNLGNNKQIKNAFQDLFDELKDVTGGKPNLDLLTANDIKIGAGAQGSWQFGKFDPDSAAKEKVYNLFYSAMKNAIEKASGGDKVKEINKVMGELIPVKNAIIKRLPVSQRQNPIGLLEGLSMVEILSSGNPMAGLLLGAKAVTGSTKAGTAMRDLSTIASETAKPAAGLLSKFISGIR